jgi:hypothetical protein
VSDEAVRTDIPAFQSEHGTAGGSFQAGSFQADSFQVTGTLGARAFQGDAFQALPAALLRQQREVTHPLRFDPATRTVEVEDRWSPKATRLGRRRRSR